MALDEARAAADEDEVPVGAIIVSTQQGVIARAHNQREALKDPTAHAEMIAITQAAQSLDSTADYIRHNDLSRMMSDVGTVVKNNPGPSIIVAVVLGFFLGRAITGREA